MEPALSRSAVFCPVTGVGLPPFPATDLDLTSPDLARQFPARAMQDNSDISDTDSALTAAPGEPLAIALPEERRVKWIATIGVSGTLHAALAAALMVSPIAVLSFQDAMQPEGADQSGANVVGSASDGQMAGAVNVALVQAPQPPKPPAMPVPASLPPKTAATPEPVTETVKQPDPSPKILVTGTPRDDDVHSSAEPLASPAAQQDNPEPELAFSGQPPVPTPRPASTDGRGAMADATGTADGEETNAPIASKGKAKTANGDAAKSRYSNEIAGKLAKANRRISKSAQAKAANNAMVTFVVLANGSITDLELAKSSGSPELDKFALNLVRDQAPFPPIPPEIGIPNWRFWAPIGPH